MTSLALPLPRAAAAPAADRRASKVYVHAIFVAILLLQRFGVMLGGSALYACLPIFALLLAAMVATGHARVRTRGALLYGLFTSVALISTLIALAIPDARFEISVASLFAVLITYALAVFGPSARFDRSIVAPLFLIYMRGIAACGIVQFLIQFAGIRIFSFMLTVPALRPILIESQFNYDPVMHYGSVIRRSNGFFLIEPSVFSQLLVFAMALDVFIRGNWRWLPLYLAGYLVSYSGTGFLVLAIALPIYSCLSARNFRQSGIFVTAGLVAIVVAAILLPDQIASFTKRTDELQYSGSSGYQRFIGPFVPMLDLLPEPRALIGFGPGATERYLYHVEGTGNSIAKLAIDYGVLGLIAFFTMFAGMVWRRDLALLSLMAVILFVVGGGYLVFAPILILVFLLCVWAEGPAAPIRRDGR